MNRRTLAFIALAVSMLYGAGFVAFDEIPNAYAAIGGVLAALAWISVGVFGRDEAKPTIAADLTRDRV